MKKTTIQQAHLAVQAAVIGKIHASRHARKFISNIVISVLKLRTSNLSKLANALESTARQDSRYKQTQRFLASFRWRESNFESVLFELLGIVGTVDLVIDRTEWKFGKAWVNILTVAAVYRGVAIPIGWKAFSRKGNLSGRRHVLALRNTINRIGVERVGKIFADREFASAEMFRYLFEEKLDFCLRLKKSHLASGISLKELCVWQSFGARVKSRRQCQVLGYEVFLSGIKLSETEYLIVATPRREKNAIAQYRQRWQIETLFGCLKSRGFDFEQTHLTRRTRIERLLLVLGLALSLAIKTGEIQIKEKPLTRKNHWRLAKSVFRVGLDKLQNLLLNLHFWSKWVEFNLLVNLLSCT